MSDSDVTALTEARTRAEIAALHAYRERVQLEVASLAGTLRGLAADAADRIDANGPDLHYQGGAHNAYLAASRLCDRALLLAEEAAGKAAPAAPDLHEAQTWTPDYQRRHVTEAKQLGVWRWRGLQKHRERIAAMVRDAQKRGVVVDFGGHDGPLGLGSIVVDKAGPATSLACMAGEIVAGIFTSHTLEHVENLGNLLHEMREKLLPQGWLIAHVPAWTCERWRAGVHGSERHGDHVWTFGLESPDAQNVRGLTNYINIATTIAASGFEVTEAEYCGDDSIIVFARAA